jgi:hypothetical protein
MAVRMRPDVASYLISQLLQRLEPQLDRDPSVRVMAPLGAVPAGQANWRPGFGALMARVQTIVAHVTVGWPRRERAENFVARYIGTTQPRGEGPQLYISGDGTVAQLIDLNRVTWHAEWVNSWALGVETGNLDYDSPPPSLNWVEANADAENLPGLKLWITSGRPDHDEVSPAWWTTANYTGPARDAVGADRMLFSEQEMQAWALVARFLMSEFGLPRNFPLLPHERRSTMIEGPSAPKFRRTVLADERVEMVQRLVAAAPINIAIASLDDPAQAATLATEYRAAIEATVPGTRQRNNRAWQAWCRTYRGLHGHGYSGSMGFKQTTGAARHEHDCPGAMFDFHRVAREVSDYWWYPFDVAAGSSAVRRRLYRHFGPDTPIIEYYFDESEADRTARISTGIHGPTGSPTTFTLNPASPIYAMSNGELVAARFPDPGTGVSLAFTLVRHDVYHARAFPSVVFMGMPLFPDSIDYNQAPESVYTLYMHLGQPTGMSFDTVTDDNPDWLNRLLIRKKECDLGVDFYDGDPAHHGIATGVWSNRPPGVPRRPTTLEGWRTDKHWLDAFLTALSSGEVAYMPAQRLAVPARVLLGDFLGESGVIRNATGPIPPAGRLHGVRVETFAPSFAAPTFSGLSSAVGWVPPLSLPAPYCLPYQSEWSRVLTPAERAAFVAIGVVDPDQLIWWLYVVLGQYLDGNLPRTARIPLDGFVFHYEPLAFAKWLNGVTWASEWPKFEVTDAAGAAVPRPARPRSRRV